MSLAHESIVGRHLSVRRTLDRIQSSFYWPAIYIVIVIDFVVPVIFGRKQCPGVDFRKLHLVKCLLLTHLTRE
jgi:hypothetical protein